MNNSMKVYSNSWLNIKFSSFCQVSNKKLPNKKFYDEFYKTAFKKYKSIDNFPSYWLEEKKIDSIDLNEIIKKNKFKNVLSLASGLGVVENNLSKLNPELNIYCNDLSDFVSWNFNNSSRVKHINLDDYFDFDFDIIYVNGLDYALNDHDYMFFLTQLSRFKSKLIMISCVVFPENLSPKNKIGHFLKGLFGWQFWGKLRSEKLHLNFFKESNLEVLKKGKTSSIEANFFLLKKND